MGFDFVGLMWEAPLVWNEFAKGFCTGVLGRARRLLSCGTRVATIVCQVYHIGVIRVTYNFCVFYGVDNIRAVYVK